jgi:hypothetical protein
MVNALRPIVDQRSLDREKGIADQAIPEPFTIDTSQAFERARRYPMVAGDDHDVLGRRQRISDEGELPRHLGRIKAGFVPGVGRLGVQGGDEPAFQEVVGIRPFPDLVAFLVGLLQRLGTVPGQDVLAAAD